MALNNVPTRYATDDMTEFAQAMEEINQRTTDLENGNANTEFRSSEPTESEMNDGIVYVWADAEGLLVFGGLDSETGTKTTTQTQVSVEDPGLIGGVVGGLL